MTFSLNGKPLTPALTEIEDGDGLNTEQRRILAENFVSNANELTNPSRSWHLRMQPPFRTRCRQRNAFVHSSIQPSWTRPESLP
jgi:hypothetical protein